MKIVVDIGGTHLRAAVFDRRVGDVVKVGVKPGYQDGKKELSEIIRNLVEKQDNQAIESINISLSGDIDTQEGKLIKFHHLEDWENRPLARDLAEVFKTKVKVENDAICAARGEYHFGGGPRNTDFIYLSWGSGVGGAVITHRQPLYMFGLGRELYPFYQRMEPGHIVITRDGRPCGCGQKGCLETYTGGKQIEKFTGIHPHNLQDPVIWQEIRLAMAQAVQTLRVAHNINQFVFGGGFIQKDAHLLPEITSILNSESTRFSPYHLRLTNLGENINLWGASTL